MFLKAEDSLGLQFLLEPQGPMEPRLKTIRIRSFHFLWDALWWCIEIMDFYGLGALRDLNKICLFSRKGKDRNSFSGEICEWDNHLNASPLPSLGSHLTQLNRVLWHLITFGSSDAADLDRLFPGQFTVGGLGFNTLDLGFLRNPSYNCSLSILFSKLCSVSQGGKNYFIRLSDIYNVLGMYRNS